jgi:hypothetical protein
MIVECTATFMPRFCNMHVIHKAIKMRYNAYNIIEMNGDVLRVYSMEKYQIKRMLYEIY